MLNLGNGCYRKFAHSMRNVGMVVCLEKGQPCGRTLVACLGNFYAIVSVMENWKISKVKTKGLIKSRIVRFEVFKLLLLEEQEEVNYKFHFYAPLPLEVKIHMWYVCRLIFGLNPWSWYICIAQGVVIWLGCEDHLLQFDVINQYCRTNTLQLEVDYRDNSRPYELSFHANL